MRPNSVLTTKNLIVGTLVGSIVIFALDSLFYAVLMKDYFTINPASDREFPDWTWLIAGLVIFMCMFAYLLLLADDPKLSAVRQGSRVGLAVGLLVGFGIGLIGYSLQIGHPIGDYIIDGLYTTVKVVVVGVIVVYIARGGKGSGDDVPPDDDDGPLVTPPG